MFRAGESSSRWHFIVTVGQSAVGIAGFAGFLLIMYNLPGWFSKSLARKSSYINSTQSTLAPNIIALRLHAPDLIVVHVIKDICLKYQCAGVTRTSFFARRDYFEESSWLVS
jgi:hypothetical protein